MDVLDLYNYLVYLFISLFCSPLLMCGFGAEVNMLSLFCHLFVLSFSR